MAADDGEKQVKGGEAALQEQPSVPPQEMERATESPAVDDLISSIREFAVKEASDNNDVEKETQATATSLPDETDVHEAKSTGQSAGGGVVHVPDVLEGSVEAGEMSIPEPPSTPICESTKKVELEPRFHEKLTQGEGEAKEMEEVLEKTAKEMGDDVPDALEALKENERETFGLIAEKRRHSKISTTGGSGNLAPPEVRNDEGGDGGESVLGTALGEPSSRAVSSCGHHQPHDNAVNESDQSRNPAIPVRVAAPLQSPEDDLPKHEEETAHPLADEINEGDEDEDDGSESGYSEFSVNDEGIFGESNMIKSNVGKDLNMLIDVKNEEKFKEAVAEMSDDEETLKEIEALVFKQAEENKAHRRGHSMAGGNGNPAPGEPDNLGGDEAAAGRVERQYAPAGVSETRITDDEVVGGSSETGTTGNETQGKNPWEDALQDQIREVGHRDNSECDQLLEKYYPAEESFASVDKEENGPTAVLKPTEGDRRVEGSVGE